MRHNLPAPTKPMRLRTRMRLIYVAGPYSPRDSDPARRATEKRRNIKNAEAMGLLVAIHGMAPVIPHTMTGRNADFDRVQDYDWWMRATQEMLLRCDGAVFIEGWKQSRGAYSEYMTCISHHIPYVSIDNQSYEQVVSESLKMLKKEIDAKE